MAQKEEGWGAVGEKSASLLLKFSTGGHLGLKLDGLIIIDYILEEWFGEHTPHSSKLESKNRRI